MRFLSRHLRVPDEAVEPGQKIKILVQFVVGKDGQISNIQFIQTNGEVFEHEVLRVMKKMPTWRPGMQNGEAVAVYFKLPVIFETQGE
jgi:protein TonB